MTPASLLAAVVGEQAPLQWLQQGRTPVARTPQGVWRAGPSRPLLAEAHRRALLPSPCQASAPQILEVQDHGEHALLLESDLGDPLPPEDRLSRLEVLHAGWPAPVSEARSGTLRVLLHDLPPLGGVNPTGLIRALRAARQDGHPLPFRPDQQHLQRALDTELGTLVFSQGWSHGALHPGRLLSGGLCHWRQAGDRLHREADRAPFLSPEAATPEERLYLLKQAWSAAPLRAADALAALLPALLAPPPEQTTLWLERAHPGLSRADLEAVLGVPLETPLPVLSAAHALGRADGLNIAGVTTRVRSDPPVRAREAVGFRQPRGRDEERLFSRWSQGVRLAEDPEARASLTPEALALALADRLGVGPGGVVHDAFCGAGGNAIAFARRGARVVATDTSAVRLEMAAHNARLYGVAERITFAQRDFFATGPLPGVDALFLDPPWSLGAAVLEQVREAGPHRSPWGMIKLPRTHPLPAPVHFSVWRTPEGFPSFLTTQWREGGQGG